MRIAYAVCIIYDNVEMCPVGKYVCEWLFFYVLFTVCIVIDAIDGMKMKKEKWSFARVNEYELSDVNA